MDRHPTGTEFFMKAPYTCNSKYYSRSIFNVSQAMSHIKSVRNKVFGPNSPLVIPYIMFQVKVSNTSEAKLVFLNGVFHHFLGPCNHKIVKTLGSHKPAKIIEFASEALATLSLNEDVIVDGLIRVDVFVNNEDCLVLNEFESLEARYFNSKQEVMIDTKVFLINYWETKIYQCLKMI